MKTTPVSHHSPDLFLGATSRPGVQTRVYLSALSLSVSPEQTDFLCGAQGPVHLQADSDHGANEVPAAALGRHAHPGVLAADISEHGCDIGKPHEVPGFPPPVNPRRTRLTAKASGPGPMARD